MTLTPGPVAVSESRDSKSASDFVSFYQKIKAQGSGIVNNEEILKFSKLFEDDITLGKFWALNRGLAEVKRDQLIALGSML